MIVLSSVALLVLRVGSVLLYADRIVSFDE